MTWDFFNIDTSQYKKYLVKNVLKHVSYIGRLRMNSKDARNISFLFVATFSASILSSLPATAGSYSAEYVFGDSLSDRGNLAELYGANFPNPPSFHDSFTNGDVAVQQLAKHLGLNANPSLWVTNFQDVHGLFPGFTPGTNYAVAGATSAKQAVGGPTGINLPQQVGAFSYAVGGAAPSSALYVIDIGGNDVRNATLQGTGPGAIAAGVIAELGAISALESEGARHFLVVDVPDVGAIPEFNLYDPSQAATATLLSQLYDTDLEAGLAALSQPKGASVKLFDLYGYNVNLLANASKYGLTDTVDPCYTDTPVSAATTSGCGTNAKNISHFVYWDQIHPTATVQALWAQGMEAAVPEPPAWALLIAGFAALGAFGYRGAARTSRA